MKGFNWQDLHPDDIEAVLSGLLVEMYRGAFRVDGRGGDGGIDVAWRSPHGLVIFQIKAFSTPLGPSQKRQIIKSLETAQANHSPQRWVLVLPLDLSGSSLKWFDEVLTPKADCTVEHIGRAVIEAELARRPHLIRAHIHTIREQALAVVAEYGAEKAVLANGVPDAVERQRKLWALLDALDPDYRFGLSVQPTGQTVSVYARHPEAFKNRPVKGSFQLTVPTDTDAGRRFADAYQDFVDFGGGIDIPSEFMDSVALDLPGGLGVDWARGSESELADPRLSLRPVAEDDEWEADGRLNVLGPSDRVVATLRVRWKGRTRGRLGARFFGADPTGCLALEVTAGTDKRCNISFTCKAPAGCTPSEALNVVRALRQIGEPNRLELQIGVHCLVTTTPTSSGTEGIDHFADFLEALERISNAAGSFTLPQQFSEEELAVIGWADHLLQGHRIELPVGDGSLTLQILDPNVMAQEIQEGELAYAVAGQEFVVPIAGRQLRIGRTVLMVVGRPKTPIDDLRRQIAACQPGDSIKLDLVVPAGKATVWLAETFGDVSSAA